MAATREAVVVILDVGASMATARGDEVLRPPATSSSSSASSASPSLTGSETMASGLERALKAVELLVYQKLMQSSRDELGLVLFGTRETHNQLSEDGYQHITVAREIMSPDIELLRYVRTITPEGASGDFIDALIVGMDLLIRKTAGKRYEKRIFLVTDAGCSVNQDDLDVVCEQFLKIDARLNIIGVGFNDDENDGDYEENDALKRTDESKRNQQLLRKFAARVNGVIVPVGRAIEMMSFIRPKPVLQRTSHRGYLEISSHLKIPIWAFVKTMERKIPTLKKVSTVSQSSGDESASSHEVKRELTYHSLSDPDIEIPPDERVKGYKYGKTLVPFSMVDETVLRYESDKALQLIGFTAAKNVPRHHFLANVECIVPEPGDGQAAAALSALVHALAETGSYAIVRYVKRNKGNPYLACLSPHIKPDLVCLHLNILPFAEDLRQYPFASLARPLRKTYSPSPAQLEATQAIIDAMDLMIAATDEDGNPMEAVKPKHTFNPTLQNLYRAVIYRIQHPNDAAIPPVDATLRQALRPDLGITNAGLKRAVEDYKSVFSFTRVEGTTKTERRYWRDRLAEGDIQLESYGSDAKKQRRNPEEGISMESLMSGATSDVGPIHPEQDFNDMLARRDVDLVDKAIEQMRERIKQLVNESVGKQLYDKAITCLRTLRHGCMIEDEHQRYNDYVEELKGYYHNKRRDDFWQLVRAHALHLPLRDFTTLSPAEPKESTEVDDEQAEAEDQRSGAVHERDSEEASADDLFDMIE